MEIKYLKILQENLTYTEPKTGITKSLEPLADNEIKDLELKYNNSNPFPIVLKELLSLAGNYCYVLDYGPFDTQKEFQENAIEFLTDNAHKGHIITRPFFALDQYGGDQFLFVYLDEGDDDPQVYQATPYAKEGKEWLFECGAPLTVLINKSMNLLLQGRNPF